MKINPNYSRATSVRFETWSNKLIVNFNGIERFIDFSKLDDSSWDSQFPIVSFEIIYNGVIVECRHEDGNTTLLPVDMWEPGGFTLVI